MAKRYIGDAVVTIEYGDDGAYHGNVRFGQYVWKFGDLHAPRMGFRFAYDSPEAYDEMAQNAVSFGSYYTTHNRGDDVPDWAPPPEVADAIEEAVGYAQRDDGTYEVKRSQTGKARELHEATMGGAPLAVRDFEAVDHRGRVIGRPTKDYQQAKREAEKARGYVRFTAGERVVEPALTERRSSHHRPQRRR